MFYNYDLNWSRPVSTKGEARYVQILKYLTKNPGSSKKEILDAIWPDRGDVVDRGYHSKTFASMRRDGLIYLTYANTWYVDTEGKKFLNWAKVA